jgi:hypothetical protein
MSELEVKEDKSDKMSESEVKLHYFLQIAGIRLSTLETIIINSKLITREELDQINDTLIDAFNKQVFISAEQSRLDLPKESEDILNKIKSV